MYTMVFGNLIIKDGLEELHYCSIMSKKSHQKSIKFADLIAKQYGISIFVFENSTQKIVYNSNGDDRYTFELALQFLNKYDNKFIENCNSQKRKHLLESIRQTMITKEFTFL